MFPRHWKLVLWLGSSFWRMGTGWTFGFSERAEHHIPDASFQVSTQKFVLNLVHQKVTRTIFGVFWSQTFFSAHCGEGYCRHCDKTARVVTVLSPCWFTCQTLVKFDFLFPMNEHCSPSARWPCYDRGLCSKGHISIQNKNINAHLSTPLKG